LRIRQFCGMIKTDMMQTLMRQLYGVKKETQSLIFPLLPVPLSNVPFHRNTKSITRYFAEGFPLHIAIHEVSPVTTPPIEYTQPHVHDDCDEVNIIISNDNLLYKIQLGADEYVVNNNSSIFIPSGVLHSANVLKGSGYFVTIRMS
jgi:mannose-6-phosphate isomerase-like protein (cupin superfamily)